MAIGSAIERGSLICVYDERGQTLFRRPGGQAPRTGCWIHQFHRHRALRLGHPHVRRTRDDDLLKGGMTDCIILGGLSRVAVPDGMPEVRSRRISVTRLLPRRWMASTVCHPARAYTRSASWCGATRCRYRQINTPPRQLGSGR